MSTEKGEPGDPFSNPLPILSIVGLWGMNIVVGAVLWCLIFSRYEPPTLWDDESKKSLYCFGGNIYLIRIRIGNCSANYDHKLTKLKFHLLDDKKKKVGSIVIPPTWLAKYSKADQLSNLPDVQNLPISICHGLLYGFWMLLEWQYIHFLKLTISKKLASTNGHMQMLLDNY
ncbi:uncharacterized protein LOC141849467 [Brevipalpus obovatus]|uniref:uncharacterized protein LOC141849467 n=1 Tax=Brevipalpus obovatus TaxID=246614 RepID=UPI003D9DEDB0